MTIYVHEPETYPTVRRELRQWSHLWAWCGGHVPSRPCSECCKSLDEFAARLGLPIAWRQSTLGGWVHYDLTPGKFEQARNHGAVVVSIREQLREWQDRRHGQLSAGEER